MPAHLSWSQVTVSFVLVAIDSAILQVLQHDVGASLVIAAFRCIAQLIAVTYVLRYILFVESMWVVACRFPTIQERVAH